MVFQKYYSKIGVKLIIPFIITFMVVLFFVGSMLYYNYLTDRSGIEATQAEVATRVTFDVNHYFENIWRGLSLTERNIVYINRSNQKVLKDLITEDVSIYSIAILDKEGLKIESLERYSSEATLKYEEVLINEIEKRHIGSVYISEYGLPLVLARMPIKDEDDNIIGILLAEIDLSQMWDDISGITFGKTGYVYVVDTKGNLVAYKDLILIRTNQNLREVQGVKNFINKGNLFSVYESFDNKRVQGIWKEVDETNFGVIVELPMDEVYKKLYFLYFFGSLSLSLFIFLFFVLFKTINKIVLRPLNLFEKSIWEIRKGNFKTRVDIDTKDEMGSLARTFNNALVELEGIEREHKQLEKSKTEFLSITSHELRSPMTPMQAQLQMLIGEHYGKLNKKQLESLDIIMRNTKRLDSIIVDLLEVSRIEAARLKFRFLKTDLTAHINRLIKEMSGFMPKKGIKIVSKIDKLPVISADPDRTMQVLRNLIGNAIKFSKPNTTVTVSVKLNDGKILFGVTDQGIGIDQKDQKRIFEPFFQAEQTMYREHQGTGLGLTIIRGIVKSQNGKVWLKSEKGKGTTFFFTIPLRPVLKAKPIVAMFSSKEDIEKKVKNIFIGIIGPMGGQEFETLKSKIEKINKKDLILYIDILKEKGILDSKRVNVFKEKILETFKEDEGVKVVKKVGVEHLIKKDLIKRENKNEVKK